MKINMEEVKAGDSEENSGRNQNSQMQTDKPLSEKGEVKSAEKRTRKALKDQL